MGDATEPPILDRLDEPPRSRWRIGLAGGLMAALLAGGGLAWWFGSGDSTAPRNLSAAQVAKAGQGGPRPVTNADPQADEAQVRRAYEQFQVVYADLGVEGLELFSRDCANAVAGDPRILDYCMAFDAFAGSVASASPWFSEAEVRHIALARAALPEGTDPAQRIVDVRRLTRAAAGQPEPTVLAEVAPPPAPEVAAPPVPQPPPAKAAVPAPIAPAVKRAAAPKAVAERPKVQKASVTPPRRTAQPARKAANRCRFEPTPAARAICGSPSLRAADRRLKQAYERAVAAGVDRQELDRQQAEWRTAQNVYANSKDALARSYELRIGQLEGTAKSAQ
jgi:uncharacterized protein YecT (DUF1311 family)